VLFSLHRKHWPAHAPAPGRGLALALAVAIAAGPAGGAAFAQDAPKTANDETAELKRELERLREKVERLEKAQGAGAGAGAEKPAPAPGPETEEDAELRELREAAAKEGGAPPPAAVPAPGAPGAEPAGPPRAGGFGAGPGSSFLAAAGAGLNAFNPRITLFGDFTGRLAVGEKRLRADDGELIDDRFDFRELEVDLRADVNPYASAVAIVAIEHEAPTQEFEIDVEEGYVTLHFLPFGFQARIGRWFVPIGRVNPTHRHDFPWVDPPLVLQDFLNGFEGYIDQGLEVSWLAPGIPLEITAELLSGIGANVYGAEQRTDEPAYLARVSFTPNLTDFTVLGIGGTFLAGKASADGEDGNDETFLLAADLILKWIPNQHQSVVFFAEFFYLDQERARVARRAEDTLVDVLDANGDPVLDADGNPIQAFVPGRNRSDFTPVGFFAGLQVQPLQQWFIGIRGDYSEFDGAVDDQDQWAIGGYLSYYVTEFLRFRVGYEYRDRRNTGELFERPPDDMQTVFFQCTFVFGSHPAEPYYVAR